MSNRNIASGRSSVVRRYSVISLAVLATATAARGQVNGTWINPTGGAWENPANWLGGNVPSGFGTATFTESLNGGRTITLGDGVQPQISTLTIDSTQVHVFNAALNALLVGFNLPASGGVFNIVRSPQSTPTTFDIGHQINVSIDGGSLTKTGAGVLTLNAFNNYVGGTFIEGGTLRIPNGDPALGLGGEPVTLSNNARLRVSLTALSTNRQFNIAPTGGIIESFGGVTLNGPIVGSGTLTRLVGGGFTIRGNNTGFTGELRSEVGTVQISGPSGAFPNAAAINYTGNLFLDNTAGSVSDRVGDAVPVVVRGGQIQMSGGASTVTSETLGTVTLATGSNIFSVLSGATGQQSLTINNLVRQPGTTLLVRGSNLGAAPGNSVSFIGTTTPPTLVGGGGPDGSQNISIVPWVVGNVTTVANTVQGTTLTTYGPRGFRPLGTNEYSTSLGGPATNNILVGNTLLNTTLSVPAAGATVNAVNVTSALSGSTVIPGTVTGTGTLTVASGAFLVSSGGIARVETPIDFGSAEGVLHLYGTTSFTQPISGTGGLIKTGGGQYRIEGDARLSTYSGPTHLNGGLILYGGNVPVNAPSPFGSSADPIVLNGGSIFNLQMWAQTDTVIDRNIVVKGDGAGVVGIGNATGAENVVINGNIDLQRVLRIEFDPTPAGVINGTISGPGRLTDAFGASVILNGNNTFTGGIEIITGTYIAGSDTAFGTGPIWATASGSAVGALSTSGGPRTINNEIIVFGGLAFSNTDTLTLTGNLDTAGRQGALVMVNTAPVIAAGKVTNGSLDVQGTGTLILTSNANDYRGLTVVRSRLQVGNGGTSGVLGAGNVSVTATGTLAFNRIDELTVPNVINGPGLVQVNSGIVNLTGTLTNFNTSVTGGELRIANGISASTSTFIVAGGAVAKFNTGTLPSNGVVGNLGSMTINAGGVVQVAGTGGTLVLGGLSIASTGYLDLGTNDLIVRNGNLSDLASAVRAWLIADGGLPGSVGLGSSAAFYTEAGAFATLAVYDNTGSSGQTVFTNFNGILVGTSDVLVKYTYVGDTNLDGVVDASDISRILQALNNPALGGWAFGDTNYDGVVDFTDLGRALAALRGQGAPLGVPATIGGGSPIPEPAALGVLAAGVPMLVRRRRA
ncbi:MAG: beta strand repeat-containing protein [Tepidisphaerales bacterium]